MSQSVLLVAIISTRIRSGLSPPNHAWTSLEAWGSAMLGQHLTMVYYLTRSFKVFPTSAQPFESSYPPLHYLNPSPSTRIFELSSWCSIAQTVFQSFESPTRRSNIRIFLSCAQTPLLDQSNPLLDTQLFEFFFLSVRLFGCWILSCDFCFQSKKVNGIVLVSKIQTPKPRQGSTYEVAPDLRGHELLQSLLVFLPMCASAVWLSITASRPRDRPMRIGSAIDHLQSPRWFAVWGVKTGFWWCVNRRRRKTLSWPLSLCRRRRSKDRNVQFFITP